MTPEQALAHPWLAGPLGTTGRTPPASRLGTSASSHYGLGQAAAAGYSLKA